ncbi:unnamed protein product [Peniophora sp. CBMAI 1063]|nr:unnamed protein product [Peniophora sp. CBMAI 1063]
MSTTLEATLGSSSLLYAYAIPLLLASLVTVFAGTFLTLHRSRSFAPRHDALALSPIKSRKLKFYLEGGIGGTLVGYAFGLHLSTFLALLIPNVTSQSALSSKAFIAVWLLSCILTSLLAARFEYAALSLAAITGGTSLALAFGITIHPPLLARQVFPALFITLLLVAVLLPTRVREAALRTSTTATGAFGFALSVALLASQPSWGSPWSRLWTSTNIVWGTPSEQGLSAGFWLILILGAASDWALKRRFGSCPDEAWDSYLADYSTALPNANDRAGTFIPDTRSVWEKLAHPFATGPTPFAMVAPGPGTPPPAYSGGLGTSPLEKDPFEFATPPRLLRKESERPMARLRALAQAESGRTKRSAVKFRPINGDDLSDDEDDDPLFPPKPARTATDTGSAESKTLACSDNGLDALSEEPELHYDAERAKLFGVRKRAAGDAESDAPDYSDVEEDVASMLKKPAPPRGGEGWRPPFIARAASSSTASISDSATLTTPPLTRVPRSPAAPPPASQQANANGLLPPPGAVPLTPSLINAIDRIAVAQHEAFGAGATGAPSAPTGMPANSERRGEHWESFWKDVTEKAGRRR